MMVADATVCRTPVDVERRQETSIVINPLNAYGKPILETPFPAMYSVVLCNDLDMYAIMSGGAGFQRA
jgi:hypothetical protein